jgi:hypothetical protein
MKKVLVLIILLLITGCNKQEEIIIEEEKIEEVIEEKYIDDNPITIGIYENDISLIKEYKLGKISNNEVIFSFYYTNQENLGSRKQKENWYKYFNEYENIFDYKIGFSFSFYVGDEKIEKTILKPDTYAFNPYFYIYIYDDINQPDNTFYSHLEETDINENTIFSAIKIFLVEPELITSNITFTVFTYNDLDDFDEDNNYRGNSKYSVDIELV